MHWVAPGAPLTEHPHISSKATQPTSSRQRWAAEQGLARGAIAKLAPPPLCAPPACANQSPWFFPRVAKFICYHRFLSRHHCRRLPLLRPRRQSVRRRPCAAGPSCRYRACPLLPCPPPAHIDAQDQDQKWKGTRCAMRQQRTPKVRRTSGIPPSSAFHRSTSSICRAVLG